MSFRLCGRFVLLFFQYSLRIYCISIVGIVQYLTSIYFFAVYRRLYSYGGQNCNQCGFPNLVCSCNLRHSLNVGTSSRQSMILIDPIEPNERVAGPAGANGSSHASTSSSGNSSSSNSSYQPTLNSGATSIGNDNENTSVSFRASTSVEKFTIPRQTPESSFAYGNRRRLEMYSDLEETTNPIFQPPKLHNFSRSNRLKDTVESQASIEVIASDATTAEASASTSSTDRELDEFNTRLLSLIECPVCLEPICPPVHQCRRGHLVI